MRKTHFNKLKFFKNLLLTTLIASTLIVSALSATGNFVSDASKMRTYKEYTVKSGDTIWQIADRFKLNQIDIRQVVYDITEKNQIQNARIYPGQTLYIPWEDEKDE